MEQILNYVKPELLVVVVALYFFGMGLKKAQTVKDKYIPLILGVIGIALCAIWVLNESAKHRTGYRNGNLYGDCPGDPGGRAFYLY